MTSPLNLPELRALRERALRDGLTIHDPDASPRNQFIVALVNSATELLDAAEENARLKELLQEALPWIEEGAISVEPVPAILERIAAALKKPVWK